MLKKRQLFFSLIFLALVSCSSHKSAEAPTFVETNRAVASQESGMTYPDEASFDLREFKGQTYVSFVKSKVKATLDKLSDKKNGGGGGFLNIGSKKFTENASHLDAKTLAGYKGAKWNASKRSYEGALSDQEVISVFETLKQIKSSSTTDSLSYFDRADTAWSTKNDMALAIKEAKVRSAPFDLATLYALTGGLGVKVKLDENNYNYHVLYKTGHTKPNEEVMSGRSFASSPQHGAADATDPEYLKDLKKYLDSETDEKPFYRALMMVLANNDTSGWLTVSPLGQSVLSDFLTVYTAECDRHLMVNLQPGNHPWEIDLAAVTFVSAVSAKTGKVVTGGQVIASDLGGWFAPSPNNKPDGPKRSGIGITRKDRQQLQRAIHAFLMTTKDGAELIKEIQAITGVNKYNKDDVIQGTFEFLSNVSTPQSLGPKAQVLADLMARFIEAASNDAEEILKLVPSK